MASPTQWTWVWASSERWWRTGKPGVLQSTRSQTVGHNCVTELNSTVFFLFFHISFLFFDFFLYNNFVDAISSLLICLRIYLVLFHSLTVSSPPSYFFLVFSFFFFWGWRGECFHYSSDGPWLSIDESSTYMFKAYLLVGLLKSCQIKSPRCWFCSSFLLGGLVFPERSLPFFCLG